MERPSQAKLICGVISPRDLLPEVERVLMGEFGNIDGRSETIPFDFTRYYTREMGNGLWRRWVAFGKLILRDEIGKIKLITIQLEKRLARGDGSRRANIDPAYLTPSKLVLTTTKDYSHRVYLGEGIFAEVTLVYEKGEFRPLRWTYADYKRDTSLRFFEQARTRLREALPK